MKSILTLVLFLVSVHVLAQTNTITGITIVLPANPDANTTNWGSGASMFTITAAAKPVNGRIDGRVQESKILVSIKKGGSKICGTYTSNSAPASNFNAANKVWSGNNAVALIGQDCTLPPGDYELCVQFFGPGPAGIMPLSEEKCRSFSIRNAEEQTYRSPDALSPAHGTILNEAVFNKPITFRWTPVVPRPRESITYRLKVWQLMQGQNGVQSMKANQPIITKDVDNLTQTTILNLITGPCKAPYLCDFIWNVQALNREGKPIGGNNGTSEAFRITVAPVNDAPSILALVTPANGSVISAKDKPKFIWTFKGIENNYSSGSNQLYKIKIVEIKGDQSPEDALKTNKPFFERDSLERKPFPYPSSAPAFIDGRNYAWNIQALNGDGQEISQSNGRSNTFTFKVAGISCGRITSTTKIECGNPNQTTGLPTYNVSITLTNTSTNTSKDCEYILATLVANGGSIIPPGITLPITVSPNSSIIISYSYSPATSNTPLASFTLNGSWNGGIGTALTLPVRIDIPRCEGVVQTRNGSICGVKFNDLNGNGIQDKDEPGIPDWHINLGGPVDMNTKTGPNGEYCFNELKPGEYLIKEEMLPGWQQTAPTEGHHRVKIKYGQNVSKIDFGNRFDVCPSGSKVWSPLGTGVNGKLYTIAHIGTDLYVGGEFTMAGGVPANNIAKWNGSSWSALGQGITGPLSKVSAILAVGTDLYVGGRFSFAGGVSANCIAKWDGYNWTALGTGISGLGNGSWVVDEITMIGNDLYAGGIFNLAGGLNAKNIAKWNGTSWSALAGGFNGVVLSISEFNGQVYAGGISGNPGGNNPTSSLQKWNGSSWSTGINAGSLTPTICDLLVVGPNLYVGGFFTQPWGTNRIAKWNGTTWTAVGAGTNGHIDAVVTIGNDIYAGGAFTTAGGASHASVAKWNGNNWSGLDGGIAGHVWAMTAIGADLYAAGNFLTAGGKSANYVAKYSCKKDNYKTTENPKPIKSNSNNSYFISDNHSDEIFEAGSKHPSEIINVRDTLFLQLENNYSSGSNQFSYTIKNLTNNRSSELFKLEVKNSPGLIQITLPIPNSIVAKGETGLLTMHNSKKYYYMSFKRN